jgi:ankyrin repeat protein
VCFDGNVVAVQRLLDEGADADEVERDEVDDKCVHADWPPHSGLNRTPLLIACRQGHEEVVRLLVERGADKYKADNCGLTPLHQACFKGHLEVVRVMLDHGTNRDTITNRGLSPLHVSCWKGHPEIIKLLLQRGATAIQVTEKHCPKRCTALLRKWQSLTPARRNAVLRLGWDYIDVPTKWTTQDHSQFPADFRQKVAAVALAWQLPMVALNRELGDLVQEVAEETHAQMGLQD